MNEKLSVNRHNSFTAISKINENKNGLVVLSYKDVFNKVDSSFVNEDYTTGKILIGESYIACDGSILEGLMRGVRRINRTYSKGYVDYIIALAYKTNNNIINIHNEFKPKNNKFHRPIIIHEENNGSSVYYKNSSFITYSKLDHKQNAV